jgi:hypothetical protein
MWIALALFGLAMAFVVAGFVPGKGSGTTFNLVLGLLWLGPPVTLALVAGSASHDCEKRIWFVATLAAVLPPMGIEVTNLVIAATSYTGICTEPTDIAFSCSYSEHVLHAISPTAGWNGIGMFMLGVPLLAWGTMVGLLALGVCRRRRATCLLRGCRTILPSGE